MAAQYAPRPRLNGSVTMNGDDDSGYGSVIEGEFEESRTINLGLRPDQNPAQMERYREYEVWRATLIKHINRVMINLKEFRNINKEFPAHYPSTHLLVTLKIFDDLTQRKLSQLVEGSSFSAVLDGKMSQIMKHLEALRSRIENTSSKVLVTGDLNAGKSTFCNALLRKRVLPEDQQPCTSIFCEVLDARENEGREELHAIRGNGPAYDRYQKNTYDAYPLERLEEINLDEDSGYVQVKVYVKDPREKSQGLLHNGLVDIVLIDGPGLNGDSLKTTEVFARQEEIDVVVFLLPAENHITESGQEFLRNAASEKAYIFVVVNKFDNIRDKGKCRRRIMDQIARLSPRTYQDADDLVHFVSANDVIDNKDPNKLEDFEALEESLRSFVLDNRSRSKLAPAKYYILNLLNDLSSLADFNLHTLGRDAAKLNEEFEEIGPKYEKAIRARSEVSEGASKIIEEVSSDIYKQARRTIGDTISHMDDSPVAEFDSVLNAFAYAEATKQAMLSNIQDSVTTSEVYARTKTTQGVSLISSLGMAHLGDEHVEKSFRPEAMFARKRHQLNRDIKVDVDFTDLFDFSFDRQETIAGASMSLTVATVASSQIFGISGWVDGIWKATNIIGIRNAKKLVVPTLIVAAAVGGWLILSDVQSAVPRKLARKIRKELASIDYVHANSDRITKETRKVLGFPADDLRSGCQRNIDKQGKNFEEHKKKKRANESLFKYFTTLMRDVKQEKNAVNGLDLEGHSKR